MDDFLRLSDETEDQNKKATSAVARVDKERVQRLKRIFLPSWMRWMEEEKPDDHENPSKRRGRNANTESK